MNALPSIPVAVVTGGTGGLGRHVARGLAGAGRRVVLLARTAARGEDARRFVLEAVPEAEVECEVADLSLLSQTRAAGERIAARHPAIPLLVLNAGVFEARQAYTAEGLDRVLAVNLLSPLVLARALLPSLAAGAPARVVITGSSSADGIRLDPDRLAVARPLAAWRGYAHSKLALLMAGFALAERLKEDGITVNVVHPGLVRTGLVRTGGPIGWAWTLIGRGALSEAEGADSPLFAALDPGYAELTGVYVKRRRPVPPNPQALRPEETRRVLAAAERLAEPWMAPWPRRAAP